ncbi:MAG: universal stress protein [Rhodoglobus sp.]
MLETILVGVDASAPSRSALAWSVSRAAAVGARLELLHVVDQERLTGNSTDMNTLRADGEALIREEVRYARSLDPDLDILSTVAMGRSADVLAKRSPGYSLLVVGTHKTGFIYGRSFGSRFLGLGWSARCNVAFIPDRLGYDRDNVVAGVEDTPTGDSVVLFAADEAARVSQELVLVSSWGEGAHPPHGQVAVARRAATVLRAVKLARQRNPHLRIRTRIVENSSAESLIEASSGAALLVIGRQRSSRGLAARAANHDVLINMSCPVIVVLDDAPRPTPRSVDVPHAERSR